MLCALLARDILWLRGLLVAAQSLLALYAATVGVMSIAWWNVAFVVINTVWVMRILRERRGVVLPDDLVELHQAQFAAVTPAEFLRLWHDGRRDRFRAGSHLARDGQFPEALYFLLDGRVDVSRGETRIAELSAGFFVGEMSLLTGAPANADVTTVGDVTAMRWDAQYLRDMRERDPVLWTKIQSVIGHDIVRKIQRAES